MRPVLSSLLASTSWCFFVVSLFPSNKWPLLARGITERFPSEPRLPSHDCGKARQRGGRNHPRLCVHDNVLWCSTLVCGGWSVWHHQCEGELLRDWRCARIGWKRSGLNNEVAASDSDGTEPKFCRPFVFTLFLNSERQGGNPASKRADVSRCFAWSQRSPTP